MELLTIQRFLANNPSSGLHLSTNGQPAPYKQQENYIHTALTGIEAIKLGRVIVDNTTIV